MRDGRRNPIKTEDRSTPVVTVLYYLVTIVRDLHTSLKNSMSIRRAISDSFVTRV